MFSLIIESYLAHAQQLSRSMSIEAGALQELLHLIEANKDSVKLDSGKEEFFKGEYAFYSGHYEVALKHYLEAKSVFRFEFFCFRASAFISKEQGSLDRALGYIKKSLEVFPEDFRSLMLYSELLRDLGQLQESKDVQTKALNLVNQESSHLRDGMNISNNEIKELVGLFSESPAENGLFCSKAKLKQASTEFLSNDKERQLYTSNIIDRTLINESYKDSLSAKIYSCPLSNSSPEITSNTFSSYQARFVLNYLATWKNRRPLRDHCLYFLEGWKRDLLDTQGGISVDEPLLSILYEGAHKSSSGIYIRWEQKGIVINPGKHFIENFHQAGLHIKDIDFVIATKDDPNTYLDIQKIYELCHQLNRSTACNENHQIIKYYLHQSAYQKLSSTLKPHSKQERYNVHKLDLFSDSLEGEAVDLSNSIRLHIFSMGGISNQMSALLELSCIHELPEQGMTKIRIGISSAKNLDQNLAGSHLLISSLDGHQEGGESYSCLQNFISEFKPQIVLCTDFDGFHGDHRFEIIRKIREKCMMKSACTVLPGDVGLKVCLKTMHIACSNDEFISPTLVKIVRSGGLFSRLEYLSPNCILS